MDTPKSEFQVVYSPLAVDELDAIWSWNAEQYGLVHADGYVQFLKAKIDHLATAPLKGRPIPSRPDIRYLLIRRKSSGHGHVAVFRLVSNVVRVLHIYHTAQDWQTHVLHEA